MAVSNRIANRQQEEKKSQVIEYQCGEEIVKISPSIIRNYLVSGNGNVTDQEVGMFLNLCRFQHLNPFLREAYLIKYGNQPATIAVGKEAITKRAMRNPAYEGQQAGVVVQNPDTGEIEYRNGSLVLKGETLVGGWAKVYVKGYQVPIEAVVSFDEYVGLKNDGTVNGQWSKKPATMIRKVALMQALREAFPADLGGMYATEEVGVTIDEGSMQPIEVEAAVVEDAPEEPVAAQATMEELGDF